MPTLEDAVILAATAHKGQKDRADLPYILHPLNVMLGLDPSDEKALIVAVLHDVVEDTSVTLENLCEKGYSEEIVSAVEALTKKIDPNAAGTGFYDEKGTEKYSHFIRRVKENPLATKVKIADLQHNADLGRLLKVEAYDLKRLDRYNRALQFLTGRYPSPDILID
jgi:(p)ppGpp synthase/HD superfamily hydrolase